jgi:hypothetical protein
MKAVFSEVTANNAFGAMPSTTSVYMNPCCNEFVNVGSFPQDSFYGAWKYAQVFPTQAKTLFDKMKGKLEKPGSRNDLNNAILIEYPYILNQYIAGYRGYLELEKLAGYTSNIDQSRQYREYTRLLNLRINNFSKMLGLVVKTIEITTGRTFMFMVPEPPTLCEPAVSQSRRHSTSIRHGPIGSFQIWRTQ